MRSFSFVAFRFRNLSYPFFFVDSKRVGRGVRITYCRSQVSFKESIGQVYKNGHKFFETSPIVR